MLTFIRKQNSLQGTKFQEKTRPETLRRQGNYRMDTSIPRAKKRGSFWNVERRRSLGRWDLERLPWSKRVAQGTRSAVLHMALTYKKSQICMLFNSLMIVVSCVFFIAGTYIENEMLLLAVEAFFAVVFFVDYVMSLLAAPVWLQYAVSLQGIINFLSMLAVFGAIKRWIYSLSFIRYLRLGEATHTIQSHRLLDRIGTFDEVTVNACLLGLKVTGLILMTTAIIYGTEQIAMTDEQFSLGEEMSWHDALYFTIVTLSTVGYGDILPLRAFSRLLMVVVILLALTYVPLEVGNLVELIGSRPKNRQGFSRRLVGDHLHVVLAMVSYDTDDDGFDARSLRRIIEELFHEDHDVDNDHLWVVVMAPCPPSPEIQSVLRSPRFMSRVVYFRGSVMDPMDLAAVCAEYADCIFLYPSRQPAPSAIPLEESTTLAAKALQRYLDLTPTDSGMTTRVEERSVTGRPNRTLVTVKELRSKHQLLRFGIDHVICHDELKMAMLACASLFPAFLPFAINAMRSSCNPDIGIHAHGPTTSAASNTKTSNAYASFDRKDTVSVAPRHDADDVVGLGEGEIGGRGTSNTSSSSPNNVCWLHDYQRGTEFEIYSMEFMVPVASPLFSAPFSRVALSLYTLSKGEVLLLAVIRDVRDHPHYYTAAVAAAAEATSAAATVSMSGSAPALRVEYNNGRSLDHNGGGQVEERFRSALNMREGGEEGSLVHVSIFPDREEYVFEGRCQVMVLAEDKVKARQAILDLQKACSRSTLTFLDEEAEYIGDNANNHNSRNRSSSKHGRGHDHSTLFPVVQRSERRGNHVTQEQKDVALWAGGFDEDVVEDVEAGVVSRAPAATVGISGDVERGVRKRRSLSEPSPFERGVGRGQSGTTSTHAAEITSSGLEQGSGGEPESAAAISTSTATAAAVFHSQSVCATATASDASEGSLAIGEDAMTQATASREGTGITASSIFSVNSRHASSGTDICGGSERGSGSGGGGCRKSVASLPTRRASMMPLGTLKERVVRPGHLRRTSSKVSEVAGSVFQTEEEQARLESVREELRKEDGIRWTEALQSLKVATAQLKALEGVDGVEGGRKELTEEAIAENPAAFFAKVQAACHSLDDALMIHAAAVPEDLSGHFVVIGAHPRLQYFVLALRRRRPDAAIVIITDEQNMFAELRESLVRAKCDESSLEISRIFSVFSRMQDRGAFREALIAQAEAVVVVSDKPNDSEVLLVSFELEQMLGELSPGTRAPKVLIDLHNDRSIYYCGNTLGRGGTVSSSFLRREGTENARLQETVGEVASAVWEWPLFAAGRIWTESIMDVFAVQTYFSAEFLAFFETLLQIRRPVLVGDTLLPDASFSSEPARDEAEARAAGTSSQGAGGDNNGSGRRPWVAAAAAGGAGSGEPQQQLGQFDQLQVSPAFVGRRYGELARRLIARGAMPLGLYRPSGTKQSILQYAHVNPAISERLVEGDAVFVLKSLSCRLFGSV